VFFFLFFSFFSFSKVFFKTVRMNDGYVAFDVDERTPAKSRRSLIEWMRENPKKAVLFCALIVLGIVLIVFLGLILALLPVLHTTVDGGSLRVSLGDLCSYSSNYSVSVVVMNPASVAVDVIGRFTVSMLRKGSPIAEMDVSAFRVEAGRTLLRLADSWRVVNATAAGLLASDVLGGADAKVTISMKLPVRVYGGIALTLPLSFEVDLNATSSSSSANATSSLNVTVTDVAASSSMVDLQVDAQAKVSAFSLLDVSLPRINLLAFRSQQLLGNVSFEPFSVHFAQDTVVAASFSR
jgi:hypothetical protein